MERILHVFFGYFHYTEQFATKTRTIFWYKDYMLGFLIVGRFSWIHEIISKILKLRINYLIILKKQRLPSSLFIKSYLIKLVIIILLRKYLIKYVIKMILLLAKLKRVKLILSSIQ